MVLNQKIAKVLSCIQKATQVKLEPLQNSSSLRCTQVLRTEPDFEGKKLHSSLNIFRC
jgi:hypothetical protein